MLWTSPTTEYSDPKADPTEMRRTGAVRTEFCQQREVGVGLWSAVDLLRNS